MAHHFSGNNVDKFKESLKQNFGATLADEFTPYLFIDRELDVLEYLAKDCVTVSHRVDDILNVMFDADTKKCVGFRLQGFINLLKSNSIPHEIKAKYVANIRTLDAEFQKVIDEYFLDKFLKENNMELPAIIVGASFSTALEAVKQGKSVQREGWNGKGLRVKMQVPDDTSKMTLPYLYLSYPKDHETDYGLRCPWVPTQTDMFADDWIVID